MNFNSCVFFALCAFIYSVAASFSAGDFVVVKGLESSPTLNGCIGIVKEVDVPSPKDATDKRVHVFVIVNDEIAALSPDTSTYSGAIKNIFKSILIKNENLEDIAWNRPAEKTFEEVMAGMSSGDGMSSWVKREVPSSEKEILKNYANLLFMIAKSTPENILAKPIANTYARLVGAWINQNYDFHAMVYACEAIRPMKPYLERAWDRIGVWQA